VPAPIRQVGPLHCQATHHAERAGDGHGDFQNGDAAGCHRRCQRQRLLFVLGAQHRHQADLAQCIQNLCFLHFFLLSICSAIL